MRPVYNPISASILLKRLFSYGLFHTKLENLFEGNSGVSWRILTYHRVLPRAEAASASYPGMYVTAESFAAQIKYLTNEASLVTLNWLLEALEFGRAIPKRTVAITFDDGWRDNYQFAFPILKQFGAPATIFVPTAFIGANSQVTAAELGIAQDNDFIRYLHTLSAISGDNRLFLNWDEITEMSQFQISFGSHSHKHEKMTLLSEDQVAEEYQTSYSILRSKNIIPVSAFCYPGGHFSETSQRGLNKSGVRFALSTDKRSILNAHPILLGRIGIHEDISSTIPLFSCRLWADRMF